MSIVLRLEFECVLSAAYLFAFAVWQHNRGIAAYWYLHGQAGACAVYADFAVERVGGCLHVLQVAYERRLYQQVAQAVGAGLVLYAGEGLE